MIEKVRLFLFVEAAAFITAALVHRGVLLNGYEHAEAATAETVIGAVLLGGLALSWVRSAATRAAGLAAQGFALVGTIVGTVMVAIGVGPRTVPDVLYHTLILITLVSGLVAAWRAGARVLL